MQRREFFAAGGQTLIFTLAARATGSTGFSPLSAEQPSQDSRDTLEQRLAAVIQAYDAQGNHRTGTEVDTTSSPSPAFVPHSRERDQTQKRLGEAVGPSRWPTSRCSRPSREDPSCMRSRFISSFESGEKFLAKVVLCSSMPRLGMPTTAVVTGRLSE